MEAKRYNAHNRTATLAMPKSTPDYPQHLPYAASVDYTYHVRFLSSTSEGKLLEVEQLMLSWLDLARIEAFRLIVGVVNQKQIFAAFD